MYKSKHMINTGSYDSDFIWNSVFIHSTNQPSPSLKSITHTSEFGYIVLPILITFKGKILFKSSKNHSTW